MTDDSAVTAAELDEMRVYAHEATKAITGLVGGGSECFGRELHGIFTADLPYCVGRIRDRIDASAERELNARRDLATLRRELAEARATIARLKGPLASAVFPSRQTLLADVDALRADNAKKDAALRPFAAYCPSAMQATEDAWVIRLPLNSPQPTFADFDRARAALAPAAQGEDHIAEVGKMVEPAPAPSAGETVWPTGCLTPKDCRPLKMCLCALCQHQGRDREAMRAEIAAAPPSAPPTRAAIIEECANVIRDELWRLPPDHDLTPTGWTRKRTFEMLLKDIRALASVKQEPT